VANRLIRAVLTAGAAVFGLFAGCVGGYLSTSPFQSSNDAFFAESLPFPHHVPHHTGGLSLRFAMVHDILHERYPKHGRVHYEERNRLTRQRISALAPDDPARLPLDDDLAAGLERLGRSEEAAQVMRDKLVRQQAKRLTGRDLYTTYANLGTFQAHASLPKAIAGDQAARERFREGIEFVRKSVEVNPEAHFGREQWQVALAEFLNAAMSDTARLRKFDFLGNRLDRPVEMLDREGDWVQRGAGRATNMEFAWGQAVYSVPSFFQSGVNPDDPAQWNQLSAIRRYISKVGAEDGWRDVPVQSHRELVAFDEPVLGIIGMWRQGGGASPHFALALGEVMLRVGQRHIAWSAYERAWWLADRYWPDPATQEFFRNHCRKRQADIERTLLAPLYWNDTQPALSAEEVAESRPRFEAELAYGEGYQRAYQEYEEKQIAAGVPITDEHFFDAFNAGREPIASPVGREEQFSWVPEGKKHEYAKQRAWACGTFGAGAAAALIAALMWWRGRAVRVSATVPSS
jgi:hypothetical protein